MIRVFLLALLALAALVLVAGRLPGGPLPRGTAEPPRASEEAGEEDLSPAAGPFARWAGTWEGTITTRRADGGVVETRALKQEHTSISPGEQKIEVTDETSGRRTVVVWRAQPDPDERLERRVTEPTGVSTLYAGSRAGGALIWRRKEASGGREEILREEILSLADGDLYRIEGFRFDPRGETLLLEGRLRRAGAGPR